ncbi:FadR/GntR family transcriptional regulator [Hoeflea sp. TYP-13]|uniref:FadR/GntR family transcriptional regulator n=1 Tax=Hoeflea sp. TYP-13 TaxID=3230023 RepID=UPI0034C5DBEB
MDDKAVKIAADTEETRKTATDNVLEAMLSLIQDGGLEPGDKLPSEGQMALDFGASRGTVRETVRALSQLGVLDVGNGRRATVAAFTGEKLAVLIDHAVRTSQVTVVQTWDFRQTLEIRVARLAALRREDSDIANMRLMTERMKNALGNTDELTEADINLHLAWARAAKNPLFVVNMESLKSVMRRTGPIGWAALGGSDMVLEHIQIHEQLTEAIAERRSEDAVQLMSRHFEVARAALYDSGLA